MRRLLGIVLTVLLASSAWAQLPVGRVIPTDNFTIGHISGTLHVAGSVSLSGGHSLVVSHVSSVLHVQSSVSPSARMFRVIACGASAATAITTTPGRRDLVLKNVGTVNIYVGGPHATVTTSNAWTLHASSAQPGTATLYLENFSGSLSCIADGPNQTLEIMEVLR